MKKRIVCVLLALIMLVSLVPATAITAAAATGSMSENAITVLKSLEKYETDCDANGYIGYGTKCTESETDHKHGTGKHTITETEADVALRKLLADLSTAVNNFAGKYGLSFNQAQHDALVMFSFENGTAWTNGTGDLQTAIRNRSTGSEFLDAICKWNYGTGDDARRMIEANMYLNGAYNSKAPSRFIRVELDPTSKGTLLDEKQLQYFDVLSTTTIGIEATPKNEKQTFAGWYYNGERVNKLTKDFHGKTLEAKYQGKNGVESDYTIKKSALASTTVYFEPNGEKKTKYVNHLDKEVTIKLADELNVIADYVDTKGVHWAKIADKKDCVIGWVKVSGAAASGSTSTDTGASADLMVTVTNSYVNMRKDASIYSLKVGTRSMGAQLRILKIKSADGFVWGQVANSPSDLTPVGWIALMYTDYETVKNNASGSVTTTPVVSGNVVARATIIYNGYVNVRAEAGTQNPIVGSLAYGTTVDVYETTYVNGIKWGRCSSGWFCMTSYAKVETLVNDTNTTEAGFASYVFSITLKGTKVYPDEVFRVSPYETSEYVEPIKKNDKRQALESTKVVVSNLVNRNGDTWAKSEYGWIKLFDAAGNLNTAEIKSFADAKFNVIANELTVRAQPENGANRVDVLSKGVELIINRIVVDKTGSTIWGYADKADPSYSGWVNLATKNVSRIGAPTVANPSTGSTTNGATAASGTVATVINTASVRVRQAASITATQVGTLTGGSTYAVLAEKDGWYKLDVDTDKNSKTDSWVYGQYLDVKSGTTGSNGTTGGTTTGKVETGLGIVANTYTGVNIRVAPGTGNAIVGKYLPGTTVEITEVTTYGASKWGRTEKGWVCMDYIAMVSNYLPQGGTTGGTTTGGTSGSVVDSTVAVYTGYVTADTKVYKEPTITSDVIRTLNAKDPVTVHELVTYVEYEDKEIYEGDDGNDGYIVQTEKRTTFWARVNDGYISLTSTGEVIKLHALDEVKYTANKAVGEISGDEINLSANETVTISKVRIVKNVLQGQVEYKDGKKAWFDLADFTKGTVAVNKEETTTPAPDNNTQNNTQNNGQATVTPPVIGSTGNTSTGGFVNNTSGYKYTGKVINTNQVNVRATASTAAKITTTLKSGAALVIYETVIAENMAWGRCDAGWVYLYYVDLTPCVNGAVDARVVYTDNAIIYTDMNMSGVAGSYSRMSVVDIYEVVGKMARTELGWVHTDDML